MPTLSNPLKDFNKPKLQSNIYVGFVINNVDEDDKRQRQRVQIRIPQKHRGVSDKDIPWAIPDLNLGSGNVSTSRGSQVGSVNIPPIGTKVYVRLDDDDMHNPRYGGSPSTDDVSKNNELLDENYPHTKGDVGSANFRDSENVEKHTRMQSHSSGTTVHIDANGRYSIGGADDVNVGSNGTVKIVSSSKIEFHAPEVKCYGAWEVLAYDGAKPTGVKKRKRPQTNNGAILGKTNQ